MTLTGGLFKPGNPPVARIAMMMGDQKLVSAEDKSPENKSPNSISIVPLGQLLVLSGASSVDPDGDLDRASFNWSIVQIYPNKRVAAKFGSTTEARTQDHVISWKPDSEGTYEAVLDLIGEKRCAFFIGWITTCRKTSSAVLRFSARKSSIPDLQVATIPDHAGFPFDLSVDAENTRTFDNEPITDLKFKWTIDGLFSSSSAKFAHSFKQPQKLKADGETHSLIGVVTDIWGQSSRPYSHSFMLQVPAATTAGAASSGQTKVSIQPSCSVSKVQSMPDYLNLTANTCFEFSDQKAIIRLPKALVTNGFYLQVKAHALVADGTVIRAFPEHGTSGINGAAGSPGSAGVPPGGNGASGTPGRNGTNGADGKSSGPIQIRADSFEGMLSINSSGMAGGPGGDGGPGGTGGDGAVGRASSSSVLDCRAGPGRGGDGGRGGAGGNGGKGGSGGNAANIDISFDKVAPNAQIFLLAIGGQAGSPGRAAQGGEGGEGGPEGATGGWCRSAGRVGSPGFPGRDGADGMSGEPGMPAEVTLTVGNSRTYATGSLRYPP